MSADAVQTPHDREAAERRSSGEFSGQSDDLLARDATTLARQIREGDLCPVELMEATLARIEAVNPTINAVCTVAQDARARAESARDAVRRGDPLGPLHGLPVGIKDATPTAGLRTTYGSKLFADHVPQESALVVKRLEAAGAIVVGKTNTPEFTAGGHTDNEVFGVTRNPWSIEHTPGGSTGGGAAALASGMIALAEGTDVGGSLRIPAAFCGVVGMRPSQGLVPTVPQPLLWDDLQTTGPMARTVADLALALQVMAGASSEWPIGRRTHGRNFVSAVENGAPDELRIGWCDSLDGPDGSGIEPEIAELCRNSIYGVGEEYGVPVGDVPLDLSAGREAFSVLRGQWMVGQHLGLLDRIDEMGDNLAGNIKAGLAASPRDVAAAQRARGEIFRQVSTALREVDVIVTPTVAFPPFRIDDGAPKTIRGRAMKSYFDWLAPTYLLTLTSLPVLAVPCGLDSNDLPVGVQIVGPVDGEEIILAVGAAIQNESGVGLPDLAGLATS